MLKKNSKKIKEYQNIRKTARLKEHYKEIKEYQNEIKENSTEINKYSNLIEYEILNKLEIVERNSGTFKKFETINK